MSTNNVKEIEVKPIIEKCNFDADIKQLMNLIVN